MSDPNLATVSIVVPMYNEEETAERLIQQVDIALESFAHPWELVVVDDGSVDRTWARLSAAAGKAGGHVKLIRFQRNFGQSAAMQAGIDICGGDIVVMLDGDLQNDPGDIPLLVRRMIDEDLDLVSGWRRDRQDALWSRKIPSQSANALIGYLTGVRLHDYGCTLKAYRGSILKNVRLYGEMHRFLPAWMAKFTSPSRIAEQPVNHRAREFGNSKYGISRTVRVVLDLLAVLFFIRYSARPGHVFGTIGLLLGALGSVILLYLLGLKIIGEDIGGRPLLLTGVLLMLVAVQLITTGVISELLARVYYESGPANGNAYLVAESRLDQSDTGGWKRASSRRASRSQELPNDAGTAVAAPATDA